MLSSVAATITAERPMAIWGAALICLPILSARTRGTIQQPPTVGGPPRVRPIWESAGGFAPSRGRYEKIGADRESVTRRNARVFRRAELRTPLPRFGPLQ